MLNQKFCASKSPTFHILTVINKLKKVLLLIFFLIEITSCKAQDVDGIWMSYNNYIIDIDSMFTSKDEGIIIDFNNQTMGTIHSDTIIPLTIDFKNSKLLLKTDSLSVDYKVYGKDSIEVNFGTNMMHVFRRLALNHKLNIEKNQINSFLIKNNFNKINNAIEIKFSDKIFSFYLNLKMENKKNALTSNIGVDEGYWYLKEIEQNFFLIFALNLDSDQNIYQIKSLNQCIMKLEQLQKAGYGNVKITELKTCL